MVSQIDYLDEPSLNSVVQEGQIEELQKLAQDVHVAKAVLEYILDIIDALRRDPDVSQGPSPRGSIGLFRSCRARALLEGRDYVIPDDVKYLAKLALGHRLHVKPEAEIEGVNAELVVERALSGVAVPKVEP